MLTSHLHVVDLAGSERIKKSGAEGGQRAEAVGINTSSESAPMCRVYVCRTEGQRSLLTCSFIHIHSLIGRQTHTLPPTPYFDTPLD